MPQPIENIGGLKNQSAKMRFSGVNFNVAENFIETTYVDEQGKPRKEYLITEEGAMLLIMGFTGEKAFRKVDCLFMTYSNKTTSFR